MTKLERQQTRVAPSQGSTSRQRRGRLVGLNLTHLLADFFGTLPAPLLRSFQRHLNVSYSSVSLLLGINTIANGVAGIALGLACDRWKRAHRAVMLLAAAFAIVAMSSIGLAGNYWLLMLLMIAGSFGCGAFHPPGFATAGELTHPHRKRGISIIMATGIAGSSLGPLFIGQLVRRCGGIWATSLCALPGLALLGVAAFLLRGQENFGVPPAAEPDPPAAQQAAVPKPGWCVALLFGNTVLRVFAHMSVLVLISKLMEDEWHLSVAASGLGVGALQCGAGLGGLFVSRLTSTGQERRTILACVPLTILMLIPLALASGRIWWLLLFAYGICINGAGPVAVSMAQRVAANRTALVSGLMVSVAFAVGGPLASITSPWLLEHVGQAQAVMLQAAPLALSGLVAAFLPRNGDGVTPGRLEGN